MWFIQGSMALCLQGQPALWEAGFGSGNSSWAYGPTMRAAAVPSDQISLESMRSLWSENSFSSTCLEMSPQWTSSSCAQASLVQHENVLSHFANMGGKCPSTCTVVICLSAIYAFVLLFSTTLYSFLTVLSNANAAWKKASKFRLFFFKWSPMQDIAQVFWCPSLWIVLPNNCVVHSKKVLHAVETYWAFACHIWTYCLVHHVDFHSWLMCAFVFSGIL